jgi:hypothetical protein
LVRCEEAGELLKSPEFVTRVCCMCERFPISHRLFSNAKRDDHLAAHLAATNHPPIIDRAPCPHPRHNSRR